MAKSPDHPQLEFVQAAGYTAGRPDGPPLWIVVHDMEASEYSGRAESTAAYFANPSDGRQVSSHYCVDDDSVIQCVRLADVAWTVGNRPGNNRGINWELAGFARQTRAEWLDPFGLAMFGQMAPICQADSRKYGIPLQRRTVAELRALQKGVTSHNDLRLAFGVTDHTDPGEAFPWDVFLRIIQGGTVQVITIAQDDKTKQLYKCDGMRSIPIVEGDIQHMRTLASEGRHVLANDGAIRGGWYEGAYGKLDPPPGSGGGGEPVLVDHTHVVNGATGPADAVPVRLAASESSEESSRTTTTTTTTTTTDTATT